jgi:hypothetical protein
MRWMNVQSQETRVVHKSKVNRRCRRPDESLLARIKPVTGMLFIVPTLLIHDMDPEGRELHWRYLPLLVYAPCRTTLVLNHQKPSPIPCLGWSASVYRKSCSY